MSFLQKIRQQETKPAHKTIKIVGMIPVYSEVDIIEESLTHLLNQGIDLVVLNNGSTDVTYKICKRFSTKIKLYLSNMLLLILS